MPGMSSFHHVSKTQDWKAGLFSRATFLTAERSLKLKHLAPIRLIGGISGASANERARHARQTAGSSRRERMTPNRLVRVESVPSFRIPRGVASRCSRFAKPDFAT